MVQFSISVLSILYLVSSEKIVKPASGMNESKLIDCSRDYW